MKTPFFYLLKNRLRFDVRQNLVLDYGNSGNGYYPDIVIFDPETNLLIDIEIDEPYIGINGEPIHYIDCDDKKRDNYFINSGWVVIRFAEEQIVRYSGQCINLIQNFINELYDVNGKTSMLSYLNEEDVSNPFYFLRWTKEDAHGMAFKRYRNSYLEFDLIEKLNEETASINHVKSELPETVDFDDLVDAINATRFRLIENVHGTYFHIVGDDDEYFSIKIGFEIPKDLDIKEIISDCVIYTGLDKDGKPWLRFGYPR